MNHVESLIQSWKETDRWAKEEMDRITSRVYNQWTTPISSGFGSNHFESGGVIPESEECDTGPGAMSGEH